MTGEGLTQRQLLLEFKNIGKSFPGTRALDHVSFQARAGEVVALLGENGAGKSTLMKILSGVWPSGSYDGGVWIRPPGSPEISLAQFRDTRDAHAAGIAMIHQELSVFSELTVGEHLELDQLPAWIRWEELHKRSQEFLDSLGLGLRSETRVGDLSVGGRQLVEIARALYRNAQVLVFDEPTSALTEQEVLRLYGIVERLRTENRTVIYITHRLDEVFRLADRMIVLRDGRNAGETSAYGESGQRLKRSELEPKLITWMVGRSIQDIYPSRNQKFTDELLRVEKLSLTSPQGKVLVKDLSFAVRGGEIVGLGGLLGAGRSETFETLFGVLSRVGPRCRGYDFSGNIWVKGRRVFIETPKEAISVRMAFVSEDRKGNGLILAQSIRGNVTLPALVAGTKDLASGKRLTSWLNSAGETLSSEKWSKELKIKAAHLDQPVRELSGGNQQKVVLAKWLLTEPDVLFLDEPTRGIDVGAKVEIYQWIQKLASQGIAILMASSEMPELLGICHRILVLREGRLSAELPAEKTSQEEIMRAASL